MRQGLVRYGGGCWVPEGFDPPSGFEMGLGCIIEDDVSIGIDVRLGHNVILKSGTRMMDDVVMGDCAQTTGVCMIGNHVRIRTGSVVSKSVILNDYAFVAAGVMTSHTKNIYYGRPQMDQRQLVTDVGYGAVLGSRTCMMAGISVAPGSIIGYDSNIVGNLSMPFGVYFGNPARLQAILEEGHQWRIEIPDDYVPYTFDRMLLKKYLPHWGRSDKS